MRITVQPRKQGEVVRALPQQRVPSHSSFCVWWLTPREAFLLSHLNCLLKLPGGPCSCGPTLPGRTETGKGRGIWGRGRFVPPQDGSRRRWGPRQQQPFFPPPPGEGSRTSTFLPCDTVASPPRHSKTRPKTIAYTGLEPGNCPGTDVGAGVLSGCAEYILKASFWAYFVRLPRQRRH